jgi:geranylgeranyl pyrophosphate synthase
MTTLHPCIHTWVDEVYVAIDTFLDNVSTPAFASFGGLLKEIVADTRRRVMRHPENTTLALLLYTAEAAGSPIEPAIHAGVGLELAGIAARILDECIDHDTEDALWTKLGTDQTILLANGLMALALLSIGHLQEHGISGALAAKIQAEFELTWFRMCQGQHKELIASADDISLDDYWEIAGAKAGELCAFATKVSAMLARSPDVEAYAAFGYHLGVLIQIMNDLQGLQNWRGKRDIGQRLTLPIIYALSTLPSQERCQLRLLLAEATHDDNASAAARELIEQSKALQFGLVQAQVCRTRAAQSLGRCPPTLLHLLDVWFPYATDPLTLE